MAALDGRQRALDLAAANSQAVAARESAPGLAQTLRIAEFSGHGEVHLPNLAFDLQYLSEPSFSFGVVMLVRPNAAEYRLPVATALLESWAVNKKGLYTGASVWLNVYVDALPNVIPNQPADCRLLFHLQFWGRAIKDVSSGEQIADNRTTGF